MKMVYFCLSPIGLQCLVFSCLHPVSVKCEIFYDSTGDLGMGGIVCSVRFWVWLSITVSTKNAPDVWSVQFSLDIAQFGGFSR